jgi:signal transduction histidine kinase
LETIRPTAKSKKITIQSFIDRQVAPIRGDPERLKQVVRNLLSNAVKFSPEAGRAEVWLERRNSFAEIRVKD